MALPIYGLFMKKCEANPKLNFYRGGFDRPPSMENDVDCSNYVQEVEITTVSEEYSKDW
jgi:penicillin-binding protein 1A